MGKSGKSNNSLLSSIIISVIFIIISVLSVYGFLNFARPADRIPVTIAQDYDVNPLNTGLQADGGIKARISEIEKASMPLAGERQVGRLTGSPGFYRTEQLILDIFKNSGLAVTTQEFETVVPNTEIMQLVDAKTGAPIPGISLYPFEPSGLITTTTTATHPVEGPLLVSGSSTSTELSRLTTTKDGKLLTLNGSILFNKGLQTFSHWNLAAQLGAKALIVSELEEENTANPDMAPPFTNYTTGFHTMYPRYYAKGPVESLEHKDVRIESSVKWKNVKARNIIGVLKSGKENKNKEALIVTAYYDSYSNVPDLAPGAEQAVPLAVMLQFAKALNSYAKAGKKPDRDIIFIATAAHGQNMTGVSKIMEAIEQISNPPITSKTFNAQIAENEEKLKYVEKALEFVGSILDTSTEMSLTSNGCFATNFESSVFKPGFRETWLKQDKSYIKWFDGVFSNLATDVAITIRKDADDARVNWTRAGLPTYVKETEAEAAERERLGKARKQHPTLTKYLEAKELDTRAAELASAPFQVATRGYKKEIEGYNYLGQFYAYLQLLQNYHADQIKQISETRALHELIGAYKNTLTINLALTSGGAAQDQSLGVVVGQGNAGSVVEPQATSLRNLLANFALENPAVAVTGNGTLDVTQFATADSNITVYAPNMFESLAWFKGARLAFTVFNNGSFPYVMGTPNDTFSRIQTDALNAQMPILAESILSIAYGSIEFKTLRNRPIEAFTLRGNVYTSLGSGSMTPSNSMFRNTVVTQYPVLSSIQPAPRSTQSYYGVQKFPILAVNPYGEYFQAFTMLPWYEQAFNIDAFTFDDTGYVSYVKDNALASQSVFKNEARVTADFRLGNTKKTNLAIFRAVPVECYQRGNPKTLNSFAGFDYLRADNMQQFSSSNTSKDLASPAVTTFLAPDSVFYVGLLDGSPDNPEIQSYRAFLLNSDLNNKNYITNDPKDTDTYGLGYLAADTPALLFPYFDAAESMIRTNAKRMVLQEKYQMDDEQMQSTQKMSMDLLKEARETFENGDVVVASNLAGRSLAAAMSNHPVIREKISNAIFGIIWYLLLLVPFAFFFEKLVFGFTDIRKQLLAIGVTFIAVFGLLYFFHPAIKMVNSPIMILLGFLICLLAVIITVMVTGKFKQIIATIRHKEGNIEGADINRGGVIGTAFMLGLNNMRRRKVRTGLTSLTLILITFVMICFTSINTSLQNKEYITGKSASNGIMRRDPQFIPLTPNELALWDQVYGLDYPTNQHYWLTYVLNPQIGWKNPEVVIDHAFNIGGKTETRRANASSVIGMDYREPAFSGIDQYLIMGRWFPSLDPTPYIIISDNAATSLNITASDFENNNTPEVMIRNFPYIVIGVFDSERLQNLVGLDGKSILPYDLNTMQSLGRSSSGSTYVVPENIQRLRAYQVVITNDMTNFPMQINEQKIAVSCSVLFPDEEYTIGDGAAAVTKPAVTINEQRKLVDEYLERVGDDSYYAIDGVSYFGSRTRTKTVGGLLALLIPILIAAMTVFNTMRGSVYERKDEIYVYNAVGIAPNHIFFMFIAEACVYAVVGALSGYLLSQVVGSILTHFNLTAGLNMDYSSIETIYASLAIVAAVLISTIIPARAAAQLASPSDETSWSIPVAEGDTMSFHLPFTFTPVDRVAILSYFHRWLIANSEGSSGPFYSSAPVLDVIEQLDPDGNMESVPVVRATIWLKPFDLGVSQKLIISLPTDEATHEYIANIEIERVGGSVAAWERTIMPFLKALRKQFLNWRAVTDADRTEMFNEAKELLKKEVND